MKCRRCGAEMVAGIATGQTVIAHEDFGGDAGQHGTTLSPGGPGMIIECLKCPECGHSVTPSRLDEIRERLAKRTHWYGRSSAHRSLEYFFVPTDLAIVQNAPADIAFLLAEIGRLTSERDINTDFHKEIVRDFESALGPHPRWDNGMYIERIREIVAERDALKADKARLVALLSRARPDVREEGSREDVLDCAIVEELDQARKEPA